MRREARYIVSLGLSLTLIMATALFVLVGVIPKDSSYQSLPWVYALVSALTAVVCGTLAKRFQEELEGQVQPQAVPVASGRAGKTPDKECIQRVVSCE